MKERKLTIDSLTHTLKFSKMKTKQLIWVMKSEIGCFVFDEDLLQVVNLGNLILPHKKLNLNRQEK